MRLALLSSLLLTTLAACTWGPGKIGGPEFKRYWKERSISFPGGVHRDRDVEPEITGATHRQQSTVLKTTAIEVIYNVRVTNIGSAPITLGDIQKRISLTTQDATTVASIRAAGKRGGAPLRPGESTTTTWRVSLQFGRLSMEPSLIVFGLLQLPYRG